jgi:hypothetical protein
LGIAKESGPGRRRQRRIRSRPPAETTRQDPFAGLLSEFFYTPLTIVAAASNGSGRRNIDVDHPVSTSFTPNERTLDCKSLIKIDFEIDLRDFCVGILYRPRTAAGSLDSKSIKNLIFSRRSPLALTLLVNFSVAGEFRRESDRSAQ